MSNLKKRIDVNSPVLTRSGDAYCEAKIDPRGRFVLEDGNAKHGHQMERGDSPLMEELPIGKLLVMALDKIDDKLSPEERRKRFTLSCRIEDAMREKRPFEMEPDDRKRLEAAADLITNSHFFLYRIHEALENAEAPRPEARANGAEARA